MALPVTDNFTGTNNTALTSYSSSWTNNVGAFRIRSNACGINYTSGDAAAHWNADTFDNNQYAEATVTAIGSTDYIGIAVRCAASGATFISFTANSNDASYLSQYVSGTYTDLGTSTAFAVGDVIRLEVSGSTVTAKINGVTKITATTSITSGYAGVGGAGNSGDSLIDGWTAGNLAGGAQTVSVTDTATISETVTVAPLARALSVSDTATISESVTVVRQSAAATLSVSVSDTVTISETVTVSKATRVASVTDTATLSESVTVAVQAVGTRSVNVSDTLTLTEAVTVAPATSRVSVSDAATLTESVTVVRQAATAALSVSVSDTVTFSESVVVLELLSACVGGVLTVNATNGRYFQNNSGPIVLAGFHTWQTIADSTDTDPPAAFGFDAFLSALVAKGANFSKLWAVETPEDWPNLSPMYFAPLPWVRSGPGTAADGKPRFDLETFEQAYFDRMRQRAIRFGNAGIYVAVQFFQGWHVAQKGYSVGTPGAYHPFNAGNNINSIDGDTNNDGELLETRNTSNTAVYALQQAYVRKVIDTLNDLDNVIWEVSNEETHSTTVLAWERAIAAYVKSYESGKAKQHPVGITKLWPGGSNSDLFASSTEWTSIDDDYPTPIPDVADGSKVVLWDTDHVVGLTTEHEWVWQSFTRGNNPVYMDEWDGSTYGTDRRADANAEKIRYNLGYVLSRAAQLDLAAMTPQGSLSNTGYCVAKTTGSKHQYIAYQPTSGNVTIDLSATSGTLTYEWLRPGTGATSGGTVAGGASRTLTNPWSTEDAVVYLWQSTYTVSVSDTATITESVTVNVSVQGTRSVSVSDTATVSETVSAALAAALRANVTDSATISELVSAALAALRTSVTDTATITEATTAALATLRANVSDTATITESTALLLPQIGVSYVSVTDNITATESIAVSVALTGVSVADTLTIGEAVTIAVGYIAPLSVTAADSLDITESVSAAMPLPLGVSVVDNVTVADVLIAYIVGLAHADWTLRDAAPWAWTLADSVTHSWTLSDRSKS